MRRNAKNRRSLPYAPGKQLTIRAHTPPTPFSKRYNNAYDIREPVRDLPDNIDRIAFALENPPIETWPPQTAKSRRLTILKKIDHRPVSRVGGPHVVICYLDSDKSQRYVAKIYDGVDYPIKDSNDFDCMYLADKDYSCEATAYQNIPLSLQGSIVPHYFGSWTFSVKTGLAHCPDRPVRMILIEHINGECMLDMILRAKGVAPTNKPAELFEDIPIDYQLLPPETERLNIMARVIEAEVALFHAGIVQGDLASRNVLIERSSNRVILIDFNCSVVLKYTNYDRYNKNDPNALPISPIERFWGSAGLVDEFVGWVPESWLMDYYEKRMWLYNRWIGSTKFAPPSKRFLTARVNDPVLQSVGAVKTQATP